MKFLSCSNAALPRPTATDLGSGRIGESKVGASPLQLCRGFTASLHSNKNHARNCHPIFKRSKFEDLLSKLPICPNSTLFLMMGHKLNTNKFVTACGIFTMYRQQGKYVAAENSTNSLCASDLNPV